MRTYSSQDKPNVKTLFGRIHGKTLALRPEYGVWIVAEGRVNIVCRLARSTRTNQE